MTSRVQDRITSDTSVVACERLGERTCVLTVRGRLDVETAPSFRDLVQDAVSGGGRDFVLDLSTVDDADASGACALVDARRQAIPEGCEVVVAASEERLLHLLEVVALTGSWPVEPTREAALARLLRAPV